ncbi:cupin domain-containing protein [Paludibaculum fermentans]|uniref:Cupin domain-containing protein n=1 Tax=Paludibaculum fermentans TaxID=1473598 RepID=A0A7S7NXB5_PALFE|nr:cupin domain-containing protein [Paludibaculum fermentans]QOY91500.1 cupin domain-containing protein [Paludibaculum fermentans]
MSEKYIFVNDLKDHSPLPENGILSRTLQNDTRTKVIQFTFAPGQELSAHTAPMPATIYIVSGEATLRLGEDTMEAAEGAFAYMTPLLEHGIQAKSEVVMLLTMIKNPPADPKP